MHAKARAAGIDPFEVERSGPKPHQTVRTGPVIPAPDWGAEVRERDEHGDDGAA
jgi:hypothetical protein